MQKRYITLLAFKNGILILLFLKTNTSNVKKRSV